MKQAYLMMLTGMAFTMAFGQSKLDTQIESDILPLLEMAAFDVQSFGKNGMEQYGPLDEPIPATWYTTKTSSSAKYFSYHIQAPFSLAQSTTGENGRFCAVTLSNDDIEGQIGIVIRAVDENNQGLERFLVQLDMHEEVTLHFFHLKKAKALEFYSLAPFGWESRNVYNGEIEIRQAAQAENHLTGIPGPDDRCSIDSRWQQFCTTLSPSSPHCVRIANLSNSGSVNAAMNAWYECTGDRTKPIFQYLQIYYPTVDDLFHRAREDDPSFRGPKCNQDLPLDINQNYAFTQSVSDPRNKHQWHTVYNTVIKDLKSIVNCVSGPCVGGSWTYQKTGRGFCGDR